MSVMNMEMEKNDDLRMEWDPFTDDHVEGLFFPGAEREERVGQLAHLLRYGAPLTLLIGRAGIGKRTLLSHLLSQLDRDLFDIAILDAGVMLDLPGLLSLLDEPWRSLRPFTPDNYLELVPAVAAAADEESKTLLCIIRHAQHLSAELVVQLQAMLAAAAGLPVKCLLLIDAAELEAVPSIGQLIEAFPESSVLYLDPLDQEQTAAYLAYRMHTAGLGEVHFGDEQVQRIHAQSQGVPAEINRVARDLLLEALPARRSAPPSRATLPWMHIGALGVVGLLLLVLVLTRSGDDGDAARPVASNTVVLENAVQAVEPPADVTPFTEVAKVAAEVAASKPEVAENADSGVVVADAPVVAPTQVISEAAVAQQAARAEPQSVPPVQTDVAARPESVVTAPVAPAPETKSVQAAPQPAAVKQPVAAPAKPAGDPRIAWLRSLPKDHYVLQLLGAQEEATVKRFLSQYPSLRKVAYYKTWRQGKPWYVVVQGDYPSDAAARAAIAQLPASLQKQSPWIRKVEIIHGQLGNP